MKLNFIGEENSYFVNNPKKFEGERISRDLVEKAFVFSFEMCFGNGFHRLHRSGGVSQRKKGELFCNTMQGKLAEILVYEHFQSKKIFCNEPDFGIFGKGIWDDSDLKYKDQNISIKSVAFFSNLLLLESKDWNKHAQYIPNLENGNSKTYNYFILVRIKPDLKKIFNSNNLFQQDNIEKEFLSHLLIDENWSFQIVGWCSNITVQFIIENGYKLPQNSLLNGRVKMDAENYYLQAGDLKDILELDKILSTI